MLRFISSPAADAVGACMLLTTGKFTGIGELSRVSGLTGRRLEIALAPLIKAGLVVTKRGRLGGYRLARTQTEIRAIDVVRAVDPWFDPPPPAELPGEARPADPLLKELTQVCERRLGEISIGQLMSGGLGAAA